MISRSATIPVAEAVAQATVLALRGDAAVTSAYIRDLRASLDVSALPAAGAGVMLAEGIMHAYDDKLSESHDRVRRAQAIATMLGDGDAASASGAWMSFIDYNRGDLIESARRAYAAIDASDGAFVHADWRAASVLAALFELAGDRLRANEWFSFARQRAAAGLDAHLMAAAIFSMAVTRLGCARFAAICSEGVVSMSDQLFLQSSAYYDRAIGAAVQGYYHVLNEGLVHAVLRQFEPAIAAFDRYEALRPGEIDPVLRAERGWCRAHAGDVAGALEDANAAADRIERLVDDDDVAIVHRRLSDIYGLAGDRAAQRRHLTASKAAATRFEACVKQAHDYLLSARPSACPPVLI